MPQNDENDPAKAVQEAAEVDAGVTESDAGPIDEESNEAADGPTASPSTEQNYTDMVKNGASTEGKGRLP